NIGMGKAGLHLDFAHEALGLALCVGPLNLQEFERFLAIGEVMPGSENGTDSSASHQSDDGIVADGLTGYEAHGTALSGLARLISHSLVRLLWTIGFETHQHHRDIVRPSRSQSRANEKPTLGIEGAISCDPQDLVDHALFHDSVKPVRA